MRIRPGTLGSCLVAAAMVLAISASPAASAPLGIPVPRAVTPADVLSQSGEGGDFQSMVPGVEACRSAPHREISPPADEAPHDDSELETWWWYGHLITPDGRRFAYQIAWTSKAWGAFYGVDYALTDLSEGAVHYGREPLILGRPASHGAAFELGGSHAGATGANGFAEMTFDIDGYEVSLSLMPNPAKPPVPGFEDGYTSPYCQTLSMYTRVRMPTSGTIAKGGDVSSVSGTSTLVREWGFLPVEAAGALDYDYLTFELDDGRDVNVIVGSFKRLPVFTAHTGYVSNPDGSVIALHRGDFTITPTRFWQRDATCSYPVEWDVTVLGTRLHARASVDDAELRATRAPALLALWPSWAITWDGETVISGDASGRGSLDMLGYCQF